MSYSTRAAIILILSVGLVISYPSLKYPPLRKATGKVLWILAWPFRAVWRVGLWIASAPAEWVRLQKEIPELAEVAQGKEQELTQAAGRMWLETQLYSHKPRHLIGNADRDHGTLALFHTELVAKTFGRPVVQEVWFQQHEEAFHRPPKDLWWQIDLWLTWMVWRVLALIFIVTYAIPREIPRFRRRGHLWLRKLRREWLSLIEQQGALRDLMEKIPERTKVYDRLESAKELRRRQRKEQDDLLLPLKSREVNFEGAKGYIKRLEIRRRYGPAKGSAVLSLEDLLRKWRVRVGRIERAQAEERSPEEIIAAIKSLVEDMSLAGKYGAKVVRVERRAQLVQSLHKRLKRRFRGMRMPDEEVKAITIIMREVVSKLWAEARWDELGDVLNTVHGHIQAYENAVLRRAWLLQAGTFEQLVGIVFNAKSAARSKQIRINPEVDEKMKQAVDGSTAFSPFAGKVRQHDSEKSPRFARRQ